MKASLTCACRGNGKAYALFEIEGASRGSDIHATCSLMDGTPVIFQEIELPSIGNKRDMVVIFPLSPKKIKVELFASSPEAPDSESCVFQKTFSPHYLKWASRLQYRINARQAHRIRDCEKDDAVFNDEIEITNLIPTDDGIVCRFAINMPDGQAGDWSVKVLDVSFQDTGIEPTVTGMAEVSKGIDLLVDRLVATMFVKIPAPGFDYSVVLLRNGKLVAFETLSRQRCIEMIAIHDEVTQDASSNPAYGQWLALNAPTESELLSQSKIELECEPKVSMLVPLHGASAERLVEMIGSVLSQSYSNWELLLFADGQEQGSSKGSADELASIDDRIKVICGGTLASAQDIGAMLKSASGDFVAFLNPDDVLAPNALFECMMALNRDGDADIVYSDSDQIDDKGRRFGVRFNPDFSKYLLREVDYMRHFRLIRRSLLQQVDFGPLVRDAAQDPLAQQHGMILRCVELSENVRHCPKVLCSTRATGAPNPKRSIVKYDVKGDPKISIVIPTKDNSDVLSNCVRSIIEKSTYGNFEVVIVENNSTEAATFENYEKLKQEDERIKVLTWDGEFNFSKINDFGADHADGEYLLFLNNDTEVISEDWLQSMLGICQQEDVGAVGAKLLFPDGTIQHGGVFVQGQGPVNLNYNLADGSSGYLDTLLTTHELSAVTGACLMCPKAVFEKVGGFDPEYAVAFNDVDLCMKIRGLGLRVIFDPNAVLYHFESFSRGYEDTLEKKLRFNKELALLRYRWSDQFVEGDPYMNVNLDPDNSWYDLPDPSEWDRR